MFHFWTPKTDTRETHGWMGKRWRTETRPVAEFSLYIERLLETTLSVMHGVWSHQQDEKDTKNDHFLVKYDLGRFLPEGAPKAGSGGECFAPYKKKTNQLHHGAC